MKAIIIDDEIHVREGIRLLADWDAYRIETILEAQDGEEAIELISLHRPEIIFTDMRMPKRDGIALLQWIQQSGIACKVIVISGYDDYNYMRKAIHYGSFDYILKPIDPEALNETLARATTEWLEEEKERQTRVHKNMEMNEVKPLYWDHVFTSLLEDVKLTKTHEEKIMREFTFSVDTDPFRVVLISVQWIIDQLFKDSKDLAYFSILNICNEFLNKNNQGMAFRNLSKEGEVVCLCWKQLDSLASLMEQIYDALQYFLKGDCTISISPRAESLNFQLSWAYQKATEVQQKHNLLEKKKRNIFTEKDIQKSYTPIHLFSYSNELKLAVQSGNEKVVREALKGIFSKLEEQEFLSFEQIDQWDVEFQLLQKHWMKEFQIESPTISSLNQEYRNEKGEFSYQLFKDAKYKEFVVLTQIFLEANAREENKTIYEIEKYIRQNYQKEIKLQEIAERFFLSREYISRKFKQEFKQNISDYLVKIRMEKAKMLLGNEHLRLYDIASQIGYQDEKYFSKVFKKVEGLTPNEYRMKLKIR